MFCCVSDPAIHAFESPTALTNVVSYPTTHTLLIILLITVSTAYIAVSISGMDMSSRSKRKLPDQTQRAAASAGSRRRVEITYKAAAMDETVRARKEPHMTTEELGHDAYLDFSKDFLTTAEADALFEALYESLTFVSTTIKLFGKEVPRPRLQSWVADADIDPQPDLYQTQPPATWDQVPGLQAVRERIQNLLGFEFNYVLVNMYRDRKDSIAWHCDEEAIPKDKSVVAGLNLGAPRRFLMRNNKNKSDKRELQVTHGSLYAMRGTAAQTEWQHSAPKVALSKVSTPRLNLTFRRS